MTRLRPYLIGLLVLALLSLGAYWWLWRPIVYPTNLIVDGDFSVGRHPIVMKEGATLTVKGNLTINGDLRCQDGPLNVTVEGDLSLNKAIACQLPLNSESNSPTPTGIALIIGGSAEFRSQSVTASNGHIQIVESPNDLMNEEELSQLFDETVMDSGGGAQIGPMGDASNNSPTVSPTKKRTSLVTRSNYLPTRVISGTTPVINRAQAQTPTRRIIIGGTMYIGSWGEQIPKEINIKKLPKKVKRVVIRAYFPNGEVEFADRSVIYSPDGQDGPDISGGCDINVPVKESLTDKKARDAMRMRVQARTITIGELDLYLGDGGRGGNATTDRDCDPIGKAIAGHGGQSGNFKMDTPSDGALTIRGPFRIHPGIGGAGGVATASGRDGKSGQIGENGRAAVAVGGNGADNIKFLRARGIKGLNNIFIDSLIAGDGGDAIANPGHGGDSSNCDTPGGLPGAGGASAGAGGIAKLDYPLEVQDLPGAADLDGQSGRPIVNDAKIGKSGPPCTSPTINNPDPAAGSATDSATKSPATPTIPPASQPEVKKSDTSTTEPPKTITPAEIKPSGFFEFLDEGYVRVVTLPSGAKVHIIVASTLGNPDMRTKLPITLEFRVDDQLIWTGIIQGDPVQVCRGADGCSMDGPVINPSWVKKQLKATGKNGEILATYSEN